MPSKKKKYNARFPPARIKKIMQTDEEVGKVAAAVPVIISRALELFVESLVKSASSVTASRNAKTLTTSHIKACILSSDRFRFLGELVKDVPDIQGEEEMSAAPIMESQIALPNTCNVNSVRGRKPKVTRAPDGAGPSHSTADESETLSAEDDDEDGSAGSSNEDMTDHRIASSLPQSSLPVSSYKPNTSYALQEALHNSAPHPVHCSTVNSADEDYDL